MSVTTDNYPGETTWKITDASDTTVASDDESITTANTKYDSRFCLASSSCYKFTIYDSYGDGILDGGTFSLTVNSNVELSNPGNGFEFSLEKEFGQCGTVPTLPPVTATPPTLPPVTPTPPTPPPATPAPVAQPNVCSDDEMEVAVSVTTDAYPGKIIYIDENIYRGWKDMNEDSDG